MSRLDYLLLDLTVLSPKTRKTNEKLKEYLGDDNETRSLSSFSKVVFFRKAT